MKDFAETGDCRRQVLLDALGAEQAYCHGCDLCNARRAIKEGVRQKKITADWQTAFNLIKKARNFYTQEDIENELQAILNCESVKKTGSKIWNHSDATEIVSQLLESGKIKKGGILWKNRLSCVTTRPLVQLHHHPRQEHQA